MVNRRPFLLTVFVNVCVLPIPFSFPEQFERIEECPFPFGSDNSVSYTHLDVYKRQGLGFMWVEDCSTFDGYDTYTQSMGVDIPLEVEVKYLLTNRARVYLNGGITPYADISSSDSWDRSPKDDPEVWEDTGTRPFILGYQLSLIHI